jgi:hypothetical protein
LVFANSNQQDMQSFQTIQLPTRKPASRAMLNIYGLEQDLKYGKNDEKTDAGIRVMLTETWLEVTREIEFSKITPQAPQLFTDIPIPTSKDLNYGISTPDSSFPYLPYIINNMWRGSDNGVWWTQKVGQKIGVA